MLPHDIIVAACTITNLFPPEKLILVSFEHLGWYCLYAPPQFTLQRASAGAGGGRARILDAVSLVLDHAMQMEGEKRHLWLGQFSALGCPSMKGIRSGAEFRLRCITHKQYQAMGTTQKGPSWYGTVHMPTSSSACGHDSPMAFLLRFRLN